MRFDLVVRIPVGSLLIGGHNAVPFGIHGVHASAGGRPIIPSTSLRGALRGTLEALVRGAASDNASGSACAGGTGLLPDADPGERPRPCRLGEHGEPCLPCRLFGGQRDGLAGDRHFAALVLGDAQPFGKNLEWTIRPGVAVGRSTRAAQDHLLQLRRIPLPAYDLEYRAHGRLLDPSLRASLEATVNATVHLGSGRSRGLGRVELNLAEPTETEESVCTLPPGDLRLRVTLQSPASIGAAIANDNLRDSRREIPGSALRGAIGFALADMRTGDDPTMECLLAEQAGADFGFLHAVESHNKDPDPGGLTAPLPITAATCKAEGRVHVLRDGLLDTLLAAHIDDPAAADRVHHLTAHRCPQCPAPLRTATGPRRRYSGVPVRTRSRVSLDRRTGAARDGHLFTQVLLEPGTTFEGTIRNIPDGTRDHLARALSAPLSLGRGRAHGWGRVAIEVTAAKPTASLADRGHAFDAALRAALTNAGLGTDRVGRLVPVTLLAPLLPDTDDGADDLCRALTPASVFIRLRRFIRDGGWDQRAGVMQPALAVAAGGVFVLELDRPWTHALDLLAALERHGAGRRRCQGYGHLLCFDPFILQTHAPRSPDR